jgi:hypothetical protein
MRTCKTIGCPGQVIHGREGDFCQPCVLNGTAEQGLSEPISEKRVMRLSELYPKYFKPVTELDEVDVYQVHELFQVQDFSGAIHHASKKLLLSGVRTGGKSKFDDIREARDTLNRWLEINKPSTTLKQVNAS